MNPLFLSVRYLFGNLWGKFKLKMASNNISPSGISNLFNLPKMYFQWKKGHPPTPCNDFWDRKWPAVDYEYVGSCLRFFMCRGDVSVQQTREYIREEGGNSVETQLHALCHLSPTQEEGWINVSWFWCNFLHVSFNPRSCSCIHFWKPVHLFSLALFDPPKEVTCSLCYHWRVSIKKGNYWTFFTGRWVSFHSYVWGSGQGVTCDSNI